MHIILIITTSCIGLFINKGNKTTESKGPKEDDDDIKIGNA